MTVSRAADTAQKSRRSAFRVHAAPTVLGLPETTSRKGSKKEVLTGNIVVGCYFNNPLVTGYVREKNQPRRFLEGYEKLIKRQNNKKNKALVRLRESKGWPVRESVQKNVQRDKTESRLSALTPTPSCPPAITEGPKQCEIPLSQNNKMDNTAVGNNLNLLSSNSIKSAITDEEVVEQHKHARGFMAYNVGNTVDEVRASFPAFVQAQIVEIVEHKHHPEVEGRKYWNLYFQDEAVKKDVLMRAPSKWKTTAGRSENDPRICPITEGVSGSTAGMSKNLATPNSPFPASRYKAAPSVPNQGVKTTNSVKETSSVNASPTNVTIETAKLPSISGSHQTYPSLRPPPTTTAAESEHEKKKRGLFITNVSTIEELKKMFFIDDVCKIVEIQQNWTQSGCTFWHIYFEDAMIMETVLQRIPGCQKRGETGKQMLVKKVDNKFGPPGVILRLRDNEYPRVHEHSPTPSSYYSQSPRSSPSPGPGNLVPPVSAPNSPASYTMFPPYTPFRGIVSNMAEEIRSTPASGTTSGTISPLESKPSIELDSTTRSLISAWGPREENRPGRRVVKISSNPQIRRAASSHTIGNQAKEVQLQPTPPVYALPQPLFIPHQSLFIPHQPLFIPRHPLPQPQFIPLQPPPGPRVTPSPQPPAQHLPTPPKIVFTPPQPLPQPTAQPQKAEATPAPAPPDLLNLDEDPTPVFFSGLDSFIRPQQMQRPTFSTRSEHWVKELEGLQWIPTTEPKPEGAAQESGISGEAGKQEDIQKQSKSESLVVNQNGVDTQGNHGIDKPNQQGTKENVLSKPEESMNILEKGNSNNEKLHEGTPHENTAGKRITDTHKPDQSISDVEKMATIIEKPKDSITDDNTADMTIDTKKPVESIPDASTSTAKKESTNTEAPRKLSNPATSEDTQSMNNEEWEDVEKKPKKGGKNKKTSRHNNELMVRLCDDLLRHIRKSQKRSP